MVLGVTVCVYFFNKKTVVLRKSDSESRCGVPCCEVSWVVRFLKEHPAPYHLCDHIPHEIRNGTVRHKGDDFGSNFSETSSEGEIGKVVQWLLVDFWCFRFVADLLDPSSKMKDGGTKSTRENTQRLRGNVRGKSAFSTNKLWIRFQKGKNGANSTKIWAHSTIPSARGSKWAMNSFRGFTHFCDDNIEIFLSIGHFQPKTTTMGMCVQRLGWN